MTGGARFIGLHVAAALLARGDRVRILDNSSTGNRENLEVLQVAEVMEGDVTIWCGRGSKESLRAAHGGPAFDPALDPGSDRVE